jgi:hypothetical protein
VVKLFREDGEALCHRLGEVLVELHALDDGDLGGQSVTVVLDGEADDFIDAELDVLLFHVYFALSYVVRGASKAAARRRNTENKRGKMRT